MLGCTFTHPPASLLHFAQMNFFIGCRQLRAFVFVFEAAHRIVVETPEYGNATYFFELESPMPVAAQVRGTATCFLKLEFPLPRGCADALCHSWQQGLTDCGRPRHR